MIELCCEYLPVRCIWLCYHHVNYAFQSESTLYSCLNVNERLARDRRNIWSLSDSNGIRTFDLFEKAIDLVRIEVICFALRFQDVPKYLVNGVMSLCQGIKTAISVEGK